MTQIPLHGTGGGFDPVPMLVGLVVAVAIWYGIRWLSTGASARERGGT